MRGEEELVEEAGGSSLPSFTDILRLLRRRKLIICFAMIVCGMMSLGLLQLLTPQYQAQATIFIDPRDRNVANTKQVTSDLVANTPSIESETEIIRSSAVAGRVIDVLGLENDKEFKRQPGLGTTIRGKIGTWFRGDQPKPPGDLAELIDATADVKVGNDPLLDTFMQRVTAERIRETFLIQVSFKSKDPEKAARIANAIADNYVKLQIETKMKAAAEATKYLDAQIDDMRKKVAKAEGAVAAFRAEHGLFDSEGHPLDQRELARQMEQLTLARNTTAELMAKFHQAKRLLDTDSDISSIGDVLKANSMTAMKQAYIEALRQQASAASRYGELHPTMMKANAALASARGELRAEIERIVTNLKSEAQEAELAQKDLEANVARLKSDLAGNNEQAVKLNELEREAKAAREVYENFLKRVQETQQQQNLQNPDSRVVNQASVPGAPISPKRTFILAAGFGGGLGLGLVLAILTEFLFPSFVRTTEIEKSFKLRHITTISKFAGGGAPAGPALSELRAILLAPHSALAQSIRTIRVAISRQRQGRQPQIVLVTSALDGEGKSVVAANLALHFSLSGVRTLLIDADLSGRGLAPRMLPRGGMSLHDCIMSRLPIGNAIVKEAATGLHFLPGVTKLKGSITPAELLASPLMAGALRKLAQDFEIIVLDGPGLLPRVDSRILAELSHQVVFVHKWGVTPQASARQALRALGHSLNKVTGVVLNQVEADRLASEDVFRAPEVPTRTPEGARREPSLAA